MNTIAKTIRVTVVPAWGAAELCFMKCEIEFWFISVVRSSKVVLNCSRGIVRCVEEDRADFTLLINFSEFVVGISGRFLIQKDEFKSWKVKWVWFGEGFLNLKVFTQRVYNMGNVFHL